jgi:hypothetical protein
MRLGAHQGYELIDLTCKGTDVDRRQPAGRGVFYEASSIVRAAYILLRCLATLVLK